MIQTRFVLTIASLILLMAGSAAEASATQNSKSSIKVKSHDGTSLAVECAGTGPTLLIVHGGTGDRGRWVPLFPHLAPRFTVCAMERRGHGESQAGESYRLEKEFQDVAVVTNFLLARKQPPL
ncbi:MAG TPA: alpha/beta fold hydrolase [Pyrinomonadaceae bacterium]